MAATTLLMQLKKVKQRTLPTSTVMEENPDPLASREAADHSRGDLYEAILSSTGVIQVLAEHHCCLGNV